MKAPAKSPNAVSLRNLNRSSANPSWKPRGRPRTARTLYLARDNNLFWNILELEGRAGRIEGIFDADPNLGLMWRSGAALTEACRSVGLEDIHVFEGDVINRDLENHNTHGDTARGAAAARQLLRFIATPGDLHEDLDRAIERSWQAAVSVVPDEAELDLKGIAAHLAPLLRDAPTPFLGAIRLVANYRLVTDGRAPSAERLLFMAAEHSFRTSGGVDGRVSWDGPALLPRFNASWIFLPSVALTQGSFRSWSPGSRSGLLDLCDGLRAELDRTLGAIPLMRRWREQSQAKAAGKHGKSRLRDLVELATHEPLLTSAHVREMLGVSERASLYIMKQAEEEGILELLTKRKTYRVWVTPHLGQSLQMRSMKRGGVMAQGLVTETGDTKVEPGPLDLESNERSSEESTQAALDELEAAMAKADAILEKYAKPKL